MNALSSDTFFLLNRPKHSYYIFTQNFKCMKPPPGESDSQCVSPSSDIGQLVRMYFLSIYIHPQNFICQNFENAFIEFHRICSNFAIMEAATISYIMEVQVPSGKFWENLLLLKFTKEVTSWRHFVAMETPMSVWHSS